MAIETRGKTIEQISKELMATTEQAETAGTRALRKTQQWYRTRVKKELATKLGIPQKSVADRFYLSPVRKGDMEAKVWIGGWSLSPYSVGKPRQIGTRTYRGKKARSMLGGVSVGRGRFYRGAFIGTVYGGREQVWIRKSSRYYNPDLYPTNKRPGDRGLAGRGNRFPVIRAAIPIDAEIERIYSRNNSMAEDEFKKKFAQELNYEINVKGR